MNAFDLVVAVAPGSTLAMIILSKDVALVEWLAAFVLLVALQFVVSWTSLRFQTMSDLVKSEPTLLLRNGRLLSDQMRRARVVEDEVAAAVRERGFASITDVAAVIHETGGSFSVIQHSAEKLPVSLG